ncbi:tRNA pseudouridine(54/55) synthase Pus10 [Natroniella sulfidigena]|uniref:tRNA pseudouridine(54/55) synthase Pus10 n=1 Tax=Natroniella sulfidigena TaxID=723921 RepID=UPI00200AD4DA|nr:tRNA pseudouridine(54/55) synthase Pus10 [Natroniella sulfidigena]MCK8817630.1 tRNA pseudouridine(54/55) synthase Pus10 [Natroniella sulfidigena]
MKIDFKTKRDKLIAEGLCDHCLGRQFAKLGYGLENYERGAILRQNEEVSKKDFAKDNVPQDAELGGECYLCQGVFEKIESYVDLLSEALEPYQFNSLLVGVSLPQQIKEDEKELWANYGRQDAELLKSELNRLIGKRVLRKLSVGVDFERPDISPVINIENERVELQISPLLIYGKYNKYVRGVSQTKWFHDRSVKSVEEIVAQPAIEVAEAEGAKFHGAGREDIDVRCFGKREFVLELLRAKKRNLNLQELEERINNYQEQVEVFELKFAAKQKIKELKSKRVAKLYKALVKTSQEIDEDKLAKLKQLSGTIRQRTPQRVNHRRKDMVRKREIYKVQAELLTANKLELMIKAEAGAYIKELISSDDGRTEPSVAELLDCSAECERLDVIGIDN